MALGFKVSISEDAGNDGLVGVLRFFVAYSVRVAWKDARGNPQVVEGIVDEVTEGWFYLTPHDMGRPQRSIPNVSIEEVTWL